MTASAAHESTQPLAALRADRQRLSGLRVGQVVLGRYGRQMRVLAVDEYVIEGDMATGPYARLAPPDAPDMHVIWTRRWYAAQGETMEMFE